MLNSAGTLINHGFSHVPNRRQTASCTQWVPNRRLSMSHSHCLSTSRFIHSWNREYSSHTNRHMSAPWGSWHLSAHLKERLFDTWCSLSRTTKINKLTLQLLETCKTSVRRLWRARVKERSYSLPSLCHHQREKIAITLSSQLWPLSQPQYIRKIVLTPF